MHEKPTAKDVKPRVLQAIKDGRIYMTESSQLGCSDFNLALALSSLGVRSAEGINIPSTNNVSILDPATLKTVFGLPSDTKFQLHSGDLKRLV